MFVLDTNHLRELVHESPLSARLRERIEFCGADVVLTIVAAEEGLRGWLAMVAAAREVSRQVRVYPQLDQLIHALGQYIRLPFDAEAAARFQQFRAQGVRIGAQDLKFACITLEHDATLLTRNTVDFAKVPGLRFKNWLE